MIKRFFATCVLLSALLLPTNAQMQFGVKGGLNAIKMSFDKDKVFDVSNRTGFFVGPTAKWTLPVGGLGFDVAAFYDQRESKVNGETIKMKSILVPFNLRLNLGFPSAMGLYLATGPQIGFNIGDDEFNWKSKGDYENTFQLKNSNFSWNLGAGLWLSQHIEVGFTYNIGMGRTADATWRETVKGVVEEDDTKPKAWTVSAAYYF